MSLNKFEPDIKNLDIAYLLGIYLTDGYVTTESVRLRVIDKDLAERFAEIGYRLFGKMPTIYKFANKHSFKQYKAQDFYEVNIYSIRLGRWLVGVTDKKSKIPDFAFNMPIEWIREFIAGLLDGDGWCSVSLRRKKDAPTRNPSWWASIGIIGKKDSYISELEKLFIKLDIDYSMTERYSDKENQETMLEYRIKTSSFTEKCLYFKCERKQKKADIVYRENIGSKYITKPISLASFND